jgi:hypothetical protein
MSHENMADRPTLDKTAKVVETLTREQVERINALYAKATPDNWHERGRAGYIVKGPSFGPAKGMVAEFDCGNYANSKEEGQANAALACALVNAWPQIRDMALRAEKAEAERHTLLNTLQEALTYLNQFHGAIDRGGALHLAAILTKPLAR